MSRMCIYTCFTHFVFLSDYSRIHDERRTKSGMRLLDGAVLMQPNRDSAVLLSAKLEREFFKIMAGSARPSFGNLLRVRFETGRAGRRRQVSIASAASQEKRDTGAARLVTAIVHVIVVVLARAHVQL